VDKTARVNTEGEAMKAKIPIEQKKDKYEKLLRKKQKLENRLRKIKKGKP
jgi:hypothetical protein